MFSFTREAKLISIVICTLFPRQVFFSTQRCPIEHIYGTVPSHQFAATTAFL